ncbi:MAG: uracil-DNA glycosylase [Chloroflexi bacterium]|nr:uracil-DNA glycosylase [Chloroflexota bacterium]
MEGAGERLAVLNQQVIACRLCPRLVAYREKVGRTKKPAFAHWDYWSRPVPGFGDPLAALLIVGLAPAAHGGNRTGRVFTGDSSARFLMSALHEAGLASQATSEHASDGLELYNTYICAAVRCVPPHDRPAPEELRNCLPYLVSELELLSNIKVVLALGRFAFRACLRALEQRAGRRLEATFAHGASHSFSPSLPTLFASYHPSPRNTNTGRLTRASLVALLLEVRKLL